MAKLTAKQRLFIDEYLLDLNATAAAIRAGYSRHTAKEIGYENLTKPHVRAVLDTALEERAERTRVDADKVVKELAKLGFSDWRELGEWDEDSMALKPSAELTDEAAACVKDVTHTTERRYSNSGEMIENSQVKLGLHDKKGALELLGRHLNMFKDNLNVTSDRPLEIKVRGLRNDSNRDEATTDSS